MKRIVLLFIITLTCTVIMAQNAHKMQQKREQIQAQKIAFITEKMQLSPEEAQVFWPVYNEYDKKKSDIERNLSSPQMRESRPDVETMSDEEINDFILKRFDKEQQLVNLNTEYFQKFKDILPVKKVYKLYEAEMQFRRMLLGKLQEFQQNQNRQQMRKNGQ